MRQRLRPTIVLAAALMVALAVLLPGTVGSGAHAQEQAQEEEQAPEVEAAADTTPVVPMMGQSTLTAAEMVAYYRSVNHLPYRVVNLNPFTGTSTPVPLEDLVNLFVTEGNRYNVRGDIAFAQSIVETAWFNFPDYGQVRPWNNNFAGIGACDSCDNGWQFPSVQEGVRAQIQLLRNYADKVVKAADLPDPPVPSLWGSTPAIAVSNFNFFSHKGRAPNWNNMGNGNWATSTTYSTTVLGVYNQMLATSPTAASAAIQARYSTLGGASSFLGAPLATDEVIPGGRLRRFAGGTIFWSPASGGREVHGGILVQYLAIGGPSSWAGFPITDETATWFGVGRFNHFQGGSIYWTPSTGAHDVRGAIRDKWGSLAWEIGFLGYPVSDEKSTWLGVGRFNHFQGGSVYWSPSTGAHEVHGGIREKWASLGWEIGLLGLPTTDETPTWFGIGRYNHFQGGSVYWSPATGAHEVHGAIRAKWASLGWELGPLGYPVTDEMPAADGVGRLTRFQGGTIYWSPSTGAYEVRGAILEQWESLGAEAGSLGYPVSDVTATVDGVGSSTRFQGGTVTWTPATGATVS